jgi:hypothetical protein
MFDDRSIYPFDVNLLQKCATIMGATSPKNLFSSSTDSQIDRRPGEAQEGCEEYVARSRSQTH